MGAKTVKKKTVKAAASKKAAPAKAGRRKAAAAEIETATRAGFCFGVKRAVDMAFEVADKNHTGTVFTYGPIIHNPQVIDKLERAGARVIEGLKDLRGRGTLIIRTHGIPIDEAEKIKEVGCEVIDATCPFVKKAQQYAKLLRDEGYHVVILGDKEHPEVKGIMSYAGQGVVVVKNASEYPPITGRVGIIVQTTKQVEALMDLVSVAVKHAKELKVYNTICNSTALRLKETEEMARRADVMVIVGGKNSANTTRLAELCESLGVKTYHIETEDEIKPSWFKGKGLIGITAGASTPDWIIKSVKKRIKDIGGSLADGHAKRGA